MRRNGEKEANGTGRGLRVLAPLVFGLLVLAAACGYARHRHGGGCDTPQGQHAHDAPPAQPVPTDRLTVCGDPIHRGIVVAALELKASCMVQCVAAIAPRRD